MFCVRAPPCAQLVKAYFRLSGGRFCGLSALIELVEPAITVRENGVRCCVPPTVSSAWFGLDVKISVTVFGCRSTVFEPVRPVESVAVKVSCRYDGYSWSGATNVPAATPGKSWTLCVWQVPLAAQCRIASRQDRAEGGRVPSWASTARPENATVWPTAQVSDAAGASMTGTGSSPAGVPTVTRAVVVAAAPWESVTRSPASTAAAVVYVQVGSGAAESSYAPLASRSQA